jgi:cytochrome b561
MTSIASEGGVDSYSSAAKWLHWIVAILIVANIPGGILLDKVPEGPIQDRLYDLHRSTGTLILALATIRLAVRLARGAPEPEPGLTSFERLASTIVHKALYALIFIVPVLGWAATSAYGTAINVYGLFVLPPILPENEGVSKVLFALHKLSALTLGGLALLHIAGALFHAIVRKDGVMARMLPGR